MQKCVRWLVKHRHVQIPQQTSLRHVAAKVCIRGSASQLVYTVLTRAFTVRLQECVEWLVEADIVQALLRAHLHQRQYVDQVQRVLKILAAEGGFQADHLELLWALTEKAGRSPSNTA